MNPPTSTALPFPLPERPYVPHIHTWRDSPERAALAEKCMLAIAPVMMSVAVEARKQIDSITIVRCAVELTDTLHAELQKEPTT